MICFGISNALASAAAGAIVKITGRLPVMIFSIVSIFYNILHVVWMLCINEIIRIYSEYEILLIMNDKYVWNRLHCTIYQ